MSWTDERVARLSKLWAEGLSASQIATDLGGVTRNAVIGKVHRLGLSGRAKSTTGGRPKRAAAEAPSAPMAGGASPAGHQSASVASVAAAVAQRASANATAGGHGAAARGGGGHTMGATAFKIEPEFEDETDAEALVEVRHQEAEDVVVPMSKRLTLLEINDHTCKWPTGDPQRPDFSFCGHGTKEGTPYCEFHAKLAFQPPSERRRRR